MNQPNHMAVLEEVRRDIAALEQQLATLRAVENYHAAKASQEGDTLTGMVTGRRHAPRNGDSKEFADIRVRDAAKIVLGRAGGSPLSTRQIADALLAGGYETRNVAGFRNAVFSALDREPQVFEKAGKGEWVLKRPS